MSIDREQFDRLNEIVEEMRVLLDEFRQIVKHGAPNRVWERAKAYPIGHIDAALDHAGNTMNTYNVTLQDIIDKLEPSIENEEDEDGDSWDVTEGDK